MKKNTAKGKKVSKGPNGERVKMPKPKHVQVLRGLAIKILNSASPQYDYYDGKKVPYLFLETLNATIMALNYNPQLVVPQMIQEGYLIPRPQEENSFYILICKQAGKNLKIKAA
ncbi:MAG: hypothetical protein A2Y67_03400 [Candidatus Buchananbacteria bacterium RBG_13_39_9]|uniref:Uncharacterized protein n=1 Tax=Candidatus Buchananbacteria bacterium RBG_13_39_9 TaxID=1797531 RepID=A0A1G1XTR3_9BACT|nr:MAG: hypothetical protein A2Y67_03400 [Candidatus Buchananbacteria bacterium RBG_13_39_9]